MDKERQYISFDFMTLTVLCSEKNLTEPSALNLWNPGRPANHFYMKLRFSSRPGAIVGCQGQVDTARAQHCLTKI